MTDVRKKRAETLVFNSNINEFVELKIVLIHGMPNYFVAGIKVDHEAYRAVLDSQSSVSFYNLVQAVDR